VTSKERLHAVSSEHELHVIMYDLWSYGSPNWTLDAAIRFVPDRYWGLLDRYFDRDGRLVAHFPPPPGQRESEPGDAEAALPAESDRRASTAWEPKPDGYVSVSELIATLHGRLALIRSRPPSDTLRASEPTVVRAVTPAVATEAPISITHEPETEPEPAEEGPEPTTLFHCEYCDQHLDVEPVQYRGVPMCPECMEKIRV
jgi:hypothetical protein